MSVPCFLEGYQLTKSYNGVVAVGGVDISLREGEVHAVIGENGAGKSTLARMLAGVTQPDGGEIRVAGQRATLSSPRHAAAAGIAIVHQELQLAPLQSVADNLLLTRPPAAAAIRRSSRAESSYVHSVISRVGLGISPSVRVCELSTAECQLLEIAKALALDAKAILFDEPTSALQPAEVSHLLGLVEHLRSVGHAILYVTHALDEVLRIADRISVLRDGGLVRSLNKLDARRENLIVAMVDRPVGLYSRQLPTPRDNVVLAVEQVSTSHVRNLTLELHEGEIIGFAGLLGSGMLEAGLALSGVHQIVGGTLVLKGEPIKPRSPREAAKAGIYFVPEERKRDGIVPDLSVCDNLHLGRYNQNRRSWFIDRQRLRTVCDDLLHRFQVRLASIDQPIASLSGGNQQKVLMARAVLSNPRILIVASPTRGVDIAAKDAIHSILLELAHQGTAIVLISPELEELLGLSHRIVVFSEGRMVGIVSRDKATPATIMDLAVGTTGRKISPIA